MSITVDIEKQLGSFKLKVSFASHGGTMGVLGASGAGKSIMLMCIAGIVTPDKGKIILNEKVLFSSEYNINLPPQSRNIGYLFQNYALFPNMTVEENIECGANKIKSKAERKAIVAKMLSKMQLNSQAKHKPSQLSGGQQQRTALARILVSNPEIILLDEPFNAIDEFLKEKLLQELNSTLTAFNKDAILVTHSRKEIQQACQTLAIINNGSIDMHSTVAEAFAKPTTVVSAMVTGCKNIVYATKVDDHTVFVPSWGISLRVKEHVSSSICAIGIQQHDFTSYGTENINQIFVTEIIEDLFTTVVKFSFLKQEQSTPSVIWKKAKEQDIPSPSTIAIDPKNILLFNKG